MGSRASCATPASGSGIGRVQVWTPVRPEPHTSFLDRYIHGMGFTTLYSDSVSPNRFAWGNPLFVRAA